MVAFAFILWHVFHTRGWFLSPWWMEHVTRPLGGGTFDPPTPRPPPPRPSKPPLVAAAYVVGVLACVYHLANGLWTMGITWGVWTSPHAQRRATILCAAVGLGLARWAWRRWWACPAWY